MYRVATAASISEGRLPDQAGACRRSDGGVTHLGDREATRPERDGVGGPNAGAPDASLQRALNRDRDRRPRDRHLVKLPVGDLSFSWAWPLDPGPGDTKI